MKTRNIIIFWILTVVVLFTITAYGANFIYHRLLLDEDYLKWKQGIESQISELQDQIEKVQEEVDNLGYEREDLDSRIDDLESQIGDLQDCCEECY